MNPQLQEDSERAAVAVAVEPELEYFDVENAQRRRKAVDSYPAAALAGGSGSSLVSTTS
jgi:hypothetical protein